jgi:hypothetical protein
MGSARNQLILLGFICQGLSWDNVFMPLINLGLWIGCLQISRRGLNLGQSGDALGMMLGCVAGFFLAEQFGASKHFFIGHGLTLLQCSRLLRRLDRREKMFSLVVALGQIAVACTVILDYRFILILLATLLFLPKALIEIELERFAVASPVLARRAVRVGWKTLLAVFAVLVVTFFGTPRGLLENTLPAPSLGGGAPGNLLQDMLDPAFGGQANSGQVLLQIDGENVEYLRMYSLTVFRDGIWLAEPQPRRRGLPRPKTGRSTNLLKRSVRVKNSRYLNRNLPVDGQVVALQGKFFRNPFVTEDGNVSSASMWSTANNRYDYWIHPQQQPEGIRRSRRHLLSRPSPSSELSTWLKERTAGATNSLAAARQLEEHFSEQFTYELGSPNLNRLSALEDFVLREQRGHCERFASAMALLLRMQDVPSRVVIGFVPGQKNWFSGWYDVRFRDAHAWTEGWFGGRGWVRFDATPRSTMNLGDWQVAEFLDALDVMWYLNVVNFNSASQTSLLEVSGNTMRTTLNALKQHLPEILMALLGVILVVTWFRSERKSGSPGSAQPEAIRFAEDCYGRMLQLLASHGFTKPVHLTPHEFVADLNTLSDEARSEVQSLTRTFCQVRYGAAQDTSSMANALGRLRGILTPNKNAGSQT